MEQIKFGTDGWRAIIDKDFIPENIERVIQAFSDWRISQTPDQKEIILGYDRRFKSSQTAELVAGVLAGNGFTVQISNQFCPTPCVSWMVKESNAIAGVMVTASHNPWEWNGIKFKEEYGGSASPEYTKEVELQLYKNDSNGKKAKKISLDQARTDGLVSYFDPNTAYANQLKSLVDIDLIKSSGYKVLVDPLYGAGTHFFKNVLGDLADEIHDEADYKFGGLNPEPIDKNLTELMTKVGEGKWNLGLATDGDADRIGAVDARGKFVNSHQIFALLLKHYVEDKKLSGPIVKSVSTTEMISILGKKYGLQVIETPIGFKHICTELIKHNALMGGEESGGISFSKHVHERDGVLNGLMLLEMMCQRKKELHELIEELYADIGEFCFDRYDLHFDREKILKMQKVLKEKKITELAGSKVQSTNFVDGFKYILSSDEWLLIRASGTEPLVRVYAEAHSMNRVKRILEEGKSIIDSMY